MADSMSSMAWTIASYSICLALFCVAQPAAERVEMTPQAMNWHLRRLREEGLVERHGHTRQIRYRLATLSQWTRSYSIGREPAEDVIWNRDVRGVLGELPDNVADIWHYGFTEMFNNAVEHSGGTRVEVSVAATAVGVEMAIGDDGCGVFRKIRESQCLLDERHAMLELSKGSLTTDPDRHSGNGMFLMCNLFDAVRIVSGGACISHGSRTESGESGDWMLRTDRTAEGTTVFLKLRSRASAPCRKCWRDFPRRTAAGLQERLCRCGWPVTVGTRWCPGRRQSGCWSAWRGTVRWCWTSGEWMRSGPRSPTKSSACSPGVTPTLN